MTELSFEEQARRIAESFNIDEIQAPDPELSDFFNVLGNADPPRNRHPIAPRVPQVSIQYGTTNHSLPLRLYEFTSLQDYAETMEDSLFRVKDNEDEGEDWFKWETIFRFREEIWNEKPKKLYLIGMVDTEMNIYAVSLFNLEGNIAKIDLLATIWPKKIINVHGISQYKNKKTARVKRGIATLAPFGMIFLDLLIIFFRTKHVSRITACSIDEATTFWRGRMGGLAVQDYDVDMAGAAWQPEGISDDFTLTDHINTVIELDR